MTLYDIVRRQPEPEPWSEGDNIPWNEPGFSERMLKWHFPQDGDGASRRSATIDRHVRFIHETVLQGKAGNILDLGCGPGHYTSRLAQLGHHCRGIDYSPASIRYARQQAEADRLDCEYLEADIRRADYSDGYDLAMLIYGEFNVFSPANRTIILSKVFAALKPGGILLLEPHTYAAVRKMGDSPATWTAEESGLFSAQPHLYLLECHWDEGTQTATWRHIIINAQNAEMTRYASSLQAYTHEQYHQVISNQGFKNITFYPSLAGEPISGQEEFLALTAMKS
jgi:SAM-dependent methyltransferase